ncbi:uncharacterized protein [Centruroides vittatus]|uniref:uncharacterized protein n=1 Tax=Centruroides vittatus TaxID=120091 RepID=UPI00350EAE48
MKNSTEKNENYSIFSTIYSFFNQVFIQIKIFLNWIGRKVSQVQDCQLWNKSKIWKNDTSSYSNESLNNLFKKLEDVIFLLKNCKKSLDLKNLNKNCEEYIHSFYSKLKLENKPYNFKISYCILLLFVLLLLKMIFNYISLKKIYCVIKVYTVQKWKAMTKKKNNEIDIRLEESCTSLENTKQEIWRFYEDKKKENESEEDRDFLFKEEFFKNTEAIKNSFLEIHRSYLQFRRLLHNEKLKIFKLCSSVDNTMKENIKLEYELSENKASLEDILKRIDRIEQMLETTYKKNMKIFPEKDNFKMK